MFPLALTAMTTLSMAGIEYICSKIVESDFVPTHTRLYYTWLGHTGENRKTGDRRTRAFLSYVPSTYHAFLLTIKGLLGIIGGHQNMEYYSDAIAFSAGYFIYDLLASIRLDGALSMKLHHLFALTIEVFVLWEHYTFNAVPMSIHSYIPWIFLSESSTILLNTFNINRGVHGATKDEVLKGGSYERSTESKKLDPVLFKWFMILFGITRVVIFPYIVFVSLVSVEMDWQLNRVGRTSVGLSLFGLVGLQFMWFMRIVRIWKEFKCPHVKISPA